MKTVIEMAREAGFAERDAMFRVAFVANKNNLERLVDLARADAIADEREKYKWDIHSCGPTCKRYACVSMREAVAAEHEVCVKLCEGIVALNEYAYADECVTVLRARKPK